MAIVLVLIILQFLQATNKIAFTTKENCEILQARKLSCRKSVFTSGLNGLEGLKILDGEHNDDIRKMLIQL